MNRGEVEGVDAPVPSRYERVEKPTLDILLAIVGLILLTPVILFASLIIIADDGLPFLFRQRRIGAGARIFTLLKLRTMKRDTPNVLSTMATPDMITRVGYILRRTNLDEIPQLLNVLRGEMSIVGPRPALPGQTSLLALRSSSGASRFRPGLTGLAQVNSYDGMPEEEKAHYDALYAETLSLKLDVKILLRTIRYLSRRPPVY